MDRRTNRPDGSGVASPTVVTSRPNGEDLDVEDDLETRPAGIVAPPRKAPSGSGTTPVPNGSGPDHTPHGVLAASDSPAQETGTDGPADGASPGEQPETEQSVNAQDTGADATIADGVPALPADNLRPSRGSRPKDSSPDPGTGQSLADDSPTFSFDRPQAAPVSPGADDWTARPPAESSAEDSSWSTPPSSLSSRRTLSGDGPPPVSPAAFAWEMSDPPSSSPSSPARNFLRGETDTKLAASAAAASAAPDTADSETKTPRGAAPALSPGRPRKSSKRSARQAHLTVARVEPWSVMKFSFVVSLVAFVILFVAVSVLYCALSALGVFESLQKVVSSVTSSQGSVGVNAAKWWSASRVLGYTALLGSLNIVLITAMSTIGAVVYNLTSRLVGGVEVTLRETELRVEGGRGNLAGPRSTSAHPGRERLRSKPRRIPPRRYGRMIAAPVSAGQTVGHGVIAQSVRARP